MPATIIDPLVEKLYERFIERHPDATIFHTPWWIRVLHESYGFRPRCIAQIEGKKICGVIPYMETNSITGQRRCISLPFSDFCGPLFYTKEGFETCFDLLKVTADKEKFRFIELRGGQSYFPGHPAYSTIFTHDIDLTLSEERLLTLLHTTTRRNIRKSDREQIQVTHTVSFQALKDFYQLNCLTRREHGLPPQSWRFFLLIMEEILRPGKGFITSVCINKKTIAASIFFFYKKRVFFKYGASDKKYQHIRPNDLMLWKSLLHCKSTGFNSLNLGRTEEHHSGLLRYKRNWGGCESEIKYFRFLPLSNKFVIPNRSFIDPIYPPIFSRLPVFVLKLIGKATYRFAS